MPIVSLRSTLHKRESKELLISVMMKKVLIMTIDHRGKVVLVAKSNKLVDKNFCYF